MLIIKHSVAIIIINANTIHSKPTNKALLFVAGYGASDKFKNELTLSRSKIEANFTAIGNTRAF